MQYLLTAPHVDSVTGQYIPAGTLVGDSTRFPWKKSASEYFQPSLSVIAVDAGAKTALASRFSVNSDGTLPLARKR